MAHGVKNLSYGSEVDTLVSRVLCVYDALNFLYDKPSFLGDGQETVNTLDYDPQFTCANDFMENVSV